MADLPSYIRVSFQELTLLRYALYYYARSGLGPVTLKEVQVLDERLRSHVRSLVDFNRSDRVS